MQQDSYGHSDNVLRQAPRVQTKALGPNQNEHARAYVQRVVDEDFEGNVNQAAPKLGISQSYLYEFLNETRGAGMKILRGVARYKKVSVDDVLGVEQMYIPGLEVQKKLRYPNRSTAIHALVEAGEATAEEAETAADAVAVTHKSDTDPPILRWIDGMRWMLGRLRRGEDLVLPGSEKLPDSAADESGRRARERFRAVVEPTPSRQPPGVKRRRK